MKITDCRLGSYLTLSVGAGVLGSQSSHAAIVYWDVTPVTITSGIGWVQPLTGATGTGFENSSPTVGMNFAGANYIYSVTEPSDGTSAALAILANGAMPRLASNATIGLALTFQANWSYMDRSGWTTAESDWATGLDGTSGFVGFRFDNAGTANYGWLEVTYNAASQELVIGDFAYDDTGASIAAGATVVPESSSLALLALGATGVLARRRRQSA